MLRNCINFFRRETGLVLIVGLFVLLAGTGIFYNFGLTTTVNDETPPFVAALKMISDHTLRPAYPTFYYLPVVAYAQLPFAVLAIFSLPLLGVATSVDAIREFVILDFAKLLPFARLASMCYGALALVVFYRIAQRLFARRRVVVFAVSFFAMSSLFVQLAHFGRVWSLQLLMFMLVLWAALRLLDEPTVRRYLFGGMSIALSFGINTIGVLAYIPFFVAHILRNRGRSFAQIFLHHGFLLAHSLMFGALLVFYYLNPYGLENYLGYIKNFFATINGSSDTMGVASRGGTHFCGGGQMDAATYYVRTLFAHEFFLSLLALCGALLFRWRFFEDKRSEVIVLGCFLVAYFLGITALSIFGIVNCEPRYILPVIPVLALLGAFGMNTLLERVLPQFHLFLTVLVFVAMLYGPIVFDVRLSLPSTRLGAREWILQNIPDGKGIINFDEKLELPEDSITLGRMRAGAPERMTVKRAHLALHPEKINIPAYFVYNPTFGEYGSGEKFEYIILSWWRPESRKAQLEQITRLGFSQGAKRVFIFPANANKNTRSLELANNEATLLDLWGLKQNGPTIEVLQIEQK